LIYEPLKLAVNYKSVKAVSTDKCVTTFARGMDFKATSKKVSTDEAARAFPQSSGRGFAQGRSKPISNKMFQAISCTRTLWASLFAARASCGTKVRSFARRQNL